MKKRKQEIKGNNKNFNRNKLKKMLKVAHTHTDGKVCYMTTNRAERTGNSFTIRGKHFIAMWNTYACIWRVYETETGYEIASFRKEFYDDFISQFKTGVMIPDPSCKPLNK